MSQLPQTSSPINQDNSFDLLEFWLRHKASIRAVTILFSAALVGYGAFSWIEKQQETAAAEAFASAKSAEELNGFISAHKGSALSGNAALLLAGKQRSDGKFEESIKTLQDFATRYPQHPLAGAAKLSIAATLEQQSKTEEALDHYRRLVSMDPRGFTAPAAHLRIARILRSQNKVDEAKAAYETLQSQFPRSSFANEALLESQELITPLSGIDPELTPNLLLPSTPSAPTGSSNAPTTPAVTVEKVAPVQATVVQPKTAAPSVDAGPASDKASPPAEPSAPKPQ